MRKYPTNCINCFKQIPNPISIRCWSCWVAYAHSRKYIESRFWKYVKKTSTCWLWIGCISPSGYGCIGVINKVIRAHRLSWILHKGNIPTGKDVLHRCDVRHCVYPSHLFIGTHQENIADRVSKNRSCHGEKHPMAKLNESQVRFIKSNLKYRTIEELANMFHMSKAGIASIAYGKNWRHV